MFSSETTSDGDEIDKRCPSCSSIFSFLSKSTNENEKPKLEKTGSHQRVDKGNLSGRKTNVEAMMYNRTDDDVNTRTNVDSNADQGPILSDNRPESGEPRTDDAASVLLADKPKGARPKEYTSGNRANQSETQSSKHQWRSKTNTKAIKNPNTYKIKHETSFESGDIAGRRCNDVVEKKPNMSMKRNDDSGLPGIDVKPAVTHASDRGAAVKNQSPSSVLPNSNTKKYCYETGSKTKPLRGSKSASNQRPKVVDDRSRSSEVDTSSKSQTASQNITSERDGVGINGPTGREAATRTPALSERPRGQSTHGRVGRNVNQKYLNDTKTSKSDKSKTVPVHDEAEKKNTKVLLTF